MIMVTASSLTDILEICELLGTLGLTPRSAVLGATWCPRLAGSSLVVPRLWSTQEGVMRGRSWPQERTLPYPRCSMSPLQALLRAQLLLWWDPKMKVLIPTHHLLYRGPPFPPYYVLFGRKRLVFLKSCPSAPKHCMNMRNLACADWVVRTGVSGITTSNL